MMQQVSPSLVSPRSESLSYNEPLPYKMNNQTSQVRLITCPHCGILSLTTGKVKNSWYLLCRCGTYVQQCVDDDYSD